MNYLWLTKYLISQENINFYPEDLKKRIIIDNSYLKPNQQRNILTYYNFNK